jgi:X-Pro dipeptidyl-peptidase
MNNWQSIDFSETINAYFSAKLLARDLTLDLPPVIWQKNNVAQSLRDYLSLVGMILKSCHLVLQVSSTSLRITILLSHLNNIVKISKHLKRIYLKTRQMLPLLISISLKLYKSMARLCLICG